MGDETLFAWGDTITCTKSADGTTGFVQALGIRYGNAEERDLYGEYFTSRTDFGQHQGDGMAATLNHRIPMLHGGSTDDEVDVMQRLAKLKFTYPVHTEATEAGILASHILELSNEYEKMIFGMAEGGHLRWSSGTAGHMVDRTDDGEILSWPVIEWAYTPMPAEPRLDRIGSVKSLESSIMPDGFVDVAEAQGPQGDSKSPGSAVADTQPADNNNATVTLKEGIQMDGEDDVKDGVGNDAEAEATVISLKSDMDALLARLAALESTPVRNVPAAGAPAVLKSGRGDTPTKAVAAWLRSGGNDFGGVKHAMTGRSEIDLARLEVKASNATDMNITTPADGGYAVPTGHYGNIVARRDESMIPLRAGVLSIPGKGTTINVTIDSEADGEFVATNEAATYDLDSPALGTAAMSLVKYTKRIPLSDELMADEDVNLMAFVENWVGRGWARTHNKLFADEVFANGTAALTLDSATAIGAGEIPELVYKLAAEYRQGAGWVMQDAIVGNLRGLQGNMFLFSQTPMASRSGNQEYIDGYPVYPTQYAPAIGSTNKSLAFGNFSLVGVRMPSELKLIIDPYTLAGNGQVRYLYSFRTVYKVLQPEAIMLATHPA